MLYVLRLTIMLLLLAMPAVASDLETDIQQTLDQAKKAAAEIKFPANKHLAEGMTAAQESANLFHSPEFQEKLECEQQRLEKEVFSVSQATPAEREAVAPGKLAENEKLYLFFSSSIPDETVHSYLAAVKRLDDPGVTMLMKGFVPSERKRYLIRIAKKDLNCVDQLQQAKSDVCERFEIPVKIQPSLFDKYEITQVPALVYEHGDKSWKITGSARFNYLLERINKQAQSPALESLIATLQRGRYE